MRQQTVRENVNEKSYLSIAPGPQTDNQQPKQVKRLGTAGKTRRCQSLSTVRCATRPYSWKIHETLKRNAFATVTDYAIHCKKLRKNYS